MRNLRMLAPLLRRLMPGLDVKPVLAELSERISAECDYELEASSHRRLARFWRGHPFITRPGGRHALSRRRVLVSEWVDGIDFAEVGRGARSGPRPLRRDHLPLLLRDRRASSTWRSATRTRATTCSATTGGSRSSTSACCATCPRGYLRREAAIFAAIRERRRADAARGDDARAGLPAGTTPTGTARCCSTTCARCRGGCGPTGPCASPPRTSGAAARPCASSGTARAHAADAPDDPAARGAAAAADGGPAVPGRLDASRGGGLGCAAAAS